jgi:hypothetical protein
VKEQQRGQPRKRHGGFCSPKSLNAVGQDSVSPQRKMKATFRPAAARRVAARERREDARPGKSKRSNRNASGTPTSAQKQNGADRKSETADDRFDDDRAAKISR